MISSQRIDEQSAEWAVRLHAGPLSAEDRRALDEWLAADSRHPGALLRAQAIWLDLDRIGALAAGRPVEETPSKPRMSRTSMLRIAAAVVALTVGAAAWWAHAFRPSVYSSDVGEIRRVRLQDGSSMMLNTATRVTVRMDESHREIRLDEGEGLFEVAKDPARPFIVRAGNVSIRALGTVFSVRAIDRQVNVTVTEGLVELIDLGQKDSTPKRIGVNEHATVTQVRRVEVTPVAPAQAEQRLAWREGMVGFDGETLSYAVTEMNRHNRRHIVIDSPDLAARPIVGLFRADDPENFAATVAIALRAQSIPEADVIHLK